MVEVEQNTPTVQAETNTRRNHTLLKVTAGILAIALAWLLYWLFYLQYHGYTDDANANGNMVNVNAVISGAVVAYYADDTDYVSEGQLLVQLDDTNYRSIYQKELEALAAAAMNVQQLYDKVGIAQASVTSKRAALEKARYDFDNRSKLVGSKAISKEDYTHARDNLEIAEADALQAEMQLQAAIDAVGSSPPQNHPLIEKQKAVVRTAYYNLQHCSIYAPASGYVAQRSVEVGQWAAPLSNLMAIIPVDYMWVDANYKETQLTYMRVGQPATVWFDLYGSSVKFEGKVLGIASGTGSVFSIIPPQNATGNWIKIVQRLPVRISLDPELLKKYPLRLGLSAEVDVDLTNQDLPYLNSQARVHAVAKTKVYRMDFEPAERLMEEIVQRNMSKSASSVL